MFGRKKNESCPELPLGPEKSPNNEIAIVALG